MMGAAPGRRGTPRTPSRLRARCCRSQRDDSKRDSGPPQMLLQRAAAKLRTAAVQDLRSHSQGLQARGVGGVRCDETRAGRASRAGADPERGPRRAAASSAQRRAAEGTRAPETAPPAWGAAHTRAQAGLQEAKKKEKGPERGREREAGWCRAGPRPPRARPGVDLGPAAARWSRPPTRAPRPGALRCVPRPRRH